MSGIKVKVVVEPGDALADLKVRLSPGDGPEEERLIHVGGTVSEATSEYELQAASTLTIMVEKLQRIVYDAEQMMNVIEDETPVDPQARGARSAPKSRGATESGAKESSHEEEKAHGSRGSEPVPKGKK